MSADTHMSMSAWLGDDAGFTARVTGNGNPRQYLSVLIHGDGADCWMPDLYLTEAAARALMDALGAAMIGGDMLGAEE